MFFIIVLLVGCTDIGSTPTPTKSNEFRCSSKKSGSTPQCWNEEDWKEFCKRVECKTTE